MTNVERWGAKQRQDIIDMIEFGEDHDAIIAESDAILYGMLGAIEVLEARGLHDDASDVRHEFTRANSAQRTYKMERNHA